MSFLILSLCLLTPPVLAGGKKGGVRISFHLQGEQNSGPNRVQPFDINGQQMFFEKIPLITHENFVAYFPFNADNGTFGAAFQLNERGQTALSRAVLERKNQYILPVINLQPGEPMIIDRAPGGFIVLWSGLGQEYFDYFEKEWKLRPISKPSDLPR